LGVRSRVIPPVSAERGFKVSTSNPSISPSRALFRADPSLLYAGFGGRTTATIERSVFGPLALGDVRVDDGAASI